MSKSIAITRINDDLSDFRYLFQLYQRILGTEEPKTLEFSQCDFLRSNAVAFLGGIIKKSVKKGIDVRINWKSLSKAVHMNLKQSGFKKSILGKSPGWKGNSVPYRQDPIDSFDEKEVVQHLLQNWIGNGRIKLGADLRNDIVQVVYEIFINSVEHSRSKCGIISCGQYHPKLEELCLTVLDLGYGIPNNVRNYTSRPNLPDGNAIKWSFVGGTSTSYQNNEARGNGLKRLSDFVQFNKGEMFIFSYKGIARTTENGNYFSNMANNYFPGTLVNIKLNCKKGSIYKYAH